MLALFIYRNALAIPSADMAFSLVLANMSISHLLFLPNLSFVLEMIEKESKLSFIGKGIQHT